MIYIISGEKNEGKTTFCQKLFKKSIANGQKPFGLYSPKVYKENEFIGYDLQQLGSSYRWPLARTKRQDAQKTHQMGRFYFFDHTFRLAFQKMVHAAITDKRPLFLDEIGKLEITGHGYAKLVTHLTSRCNQDLYFAIRKQNIPDFLRVFNIKKHQIITLPTQK